MSWNASESTKDPYRNAKATSDSPDNPSASVAAARARETGSTRWSRLIVNRSGTASSTGFTYYPPAPRSACGEATAEPDREAVGACAARGAFRLVTSPPIVAELARALAYPKLQIPPDAAYAFTGLVVSLTEPDGLVRIKGRLSVLRRDPADNAGLETALAGRAACLVTGNLRHFDELGADPERRLRGLRIVSPREFVQTLGG